jgi:hypothetical protein
LAIVKGNSTGKIVLTGTLPEIEELHCMDMNNEMIRLIGIKSNAPAFEDRRLGHLSLQNLSTPGHPSDGDNRTLTKRLHYIFFRFPKRRVDQSITKTTTSDSIMIMGTHCQNEIGPIYSE